MNQIDMPELPEVEVFVNGQRFAGKCEIRIKTEPPVPVEDFLWGNFDPEKVRVSYRVFLLPDNEEPIEMKSGEITIGQRIEIITPSLM